MTNCPHCGEPLECLDYSVEAIQHGYATIENGRLCPNNGEQEWNVTHWQCPECGNEVATDQWDCDDNAKALLGLK